MISQTKPLKAKSFLPFNFSVTKICVAIRLAEDGTRMGGKYFQLSPSNNLIHEFALTSVRNSNKVFFDTLTNLHQSFVSMFYKKRAVENESLVSIYINCLV